MLNVIILKALGELHSLQYFITYCFKVIKIYFKEPFFKGGEWQTQTKLDRWIITDIWHMEYQMGSVAPYEYAGLDRTGLGPCIPKSGDEFIPFCFAKGPANALTNPNRISSATSRRSNIMRRRFNRSRTLKKRQSKPAIE